MRGRRGRFPGGSAGRADSPRIPPPPALYGSSRRNSAGLDLSQQAVRERIGDAVAKLDADGPIAVGPIFGGLTRVSHGERRKMPADIARFVGSVSTSTPAEVDAAFASAAGYQPTWNALGGAKRRHVLAIHDDLPAGG